ncbi:MAG: hypothetical protein K9L84_02610 [Candidatus Omnitrophica bacterium]|nr:hypothetical protein [Candidatus Omnitrophota bacterium]MCF7893933.1 hypothetical protein [Candidatus Omnitrophota bacterium]
MKPEEKIINYFTILKSKKIIGSSYIFIGNNFSIINRLLKLINCTDSSRFCNQCWSCKRIEDLHHPDLLIVKPDQTSIKINQLREAVHFLSRKSYYSPKKSLIIKDSQKLTDQAANLFLKTLEEPPNNSFIGLICPKLEDILPTIISRCRKIYLPYSKGKLGKSRDEVKDLLRTGYFGSKKRKDFSLFIESLIILLHNQLKNNMGYSDNQPDDSLSLDLNFEETIVALEDLFKVYNAAGNVNTNLALNLIKMRLRCN